MTGTTVETTGYCDGVGGRLWWKSIAPAPDGDPAAAEATPIVLLHGGPGTPSYYLEPLEALAADRRVIVYDQLGCGRSDIPGDPALWTVGTFVEDLEILTRELGLESFHLYGHSWGGSLALAYIADHPERVASAVLASPLVDVARWVSDADGLIAALPDEHRRGLAEPVGTPAYQAAEAEFYRRHFCALDPYPESLRLTNEGLSAVVYNTMWGPNEFTQSGNLKGLDLTPVVRSLAVPNLWICGSEDEARPDTIREFSEMNSAGEYVEFAGGTHCVHLEQTDAYLGALRGFLRD